MNSNAVKEPTYSEDYAWGYTEALVIKFKNKKAWFALVPSGIYVAIKLLLLFIETHLVIPF